MEVLVLDGKNFVKASKAARDLGYASDYVGQLCRTGQVEAHLIGRTWYVNTDQLGTHRVEKKRMSRTKAREQAKKLIAEHRLVNATNTYRNIDISYQSDSEPLIPETKKLEVISTSPKNAGRVIDDYVPEDTIIENLGEKVLMSGGLKILDASEDAFDSDTTILTPRTIRSSPQKAFVKKLFATSQEPPRKSFREKIEENIVPEEGTTMGEEVTELKNRPVAGISTSKPAQSSSFLSVSVVTVLLLIVASLTLPMSLRLTYDASSKTHYSSKLLFSIDQAKKLIKEKF